MDYILTTNNLHLCNAYRVRRWKMRVVLKRIKYNGELSDAEGPAIFSRVWTRSLFSLKQEWLCHNTLYWLGIQRDRTKDAAYTMSIARMVAKLASI